MGYTAKNKEVQEWQLDVLLWVRCLRQAVPAVPVMYLWFTDLGLGMEEVFLVTSLASAVTVVAEIPSGWVADRLGRKATLVVSFLLLCIGYLLLGMGFVWASAVVKPIGCALFSGTDVALLHETVRSLNLEKKDALKHESRHISYVTTTEAVFSVFGGFLLPQHAIILSALPTFIGAVLAGFLTNPTTPNEASIYNPIPYAVVFRNASHGILTPLSILSTFTYISVWLAPVLWRAHGLSPAVYGWVWFAVNAAGSVGSMYAPKILALVGGSEGSVVAMLSFATAVCYMLFTLPHVAFVLLANSILGVVRGVMWPMTSSYINKQVGLQDGTRATTLSAYAGICKALSIVAGPLVGKSIEMYSAGPTCTMLSVLALSLLAVV